MKTRILTLALLTTSLLSCSKTDDDSHTDEGEVITTVILKLTDKDNKTITLTSKDADGDGPNAPITTIVGELKANTVYQGETSFLNELTSPATDLTTEISQEGKDHQIFFQMPTTLGTTTYTDLDASGRPIGLKFQMTTATTPALAQNLIVTLRHLPNKSATGVSAGLIANAQGSTDAEVIFKVDLK